MDLPSTSDRALGCAFFVSKSSLHLEALPEFQVRG